MFFNFLFAYHITHLCSEHAKQWKPQEGVWFPYWMKYQIFAPLVALQIVNLFWYFLILRVLYRYVSTNLFIFRQDQSVILTY